MAKDQYLVLARKWRPQRFEDVVGQDHITRTLQNAITSNRVAHAFLFIGSRGIGKTTTARILAKALNCLNVDKPTPTPCGECANCQSIAAGNNIDVIEIDGASNRGIDDAKQIRENVRLVPSSSRYKIYIIDEVHQLSRDAFNALLKTIEEPPPHAVFVLATTEAHKVPATIVSRCQRYDFRRIGLDRTCELLRTILENERVKCSDEALRAIARSADGGIRDAESILEQLISYCDKEITFQDVFDVLGLVDWQVLHDLCDAIVDKDVGRQLRIVEDVVVRGKDLSQFVQDILQYWRNLLVCKTTEAKDLLALPEEDIVALQARAAKFSLMGAIRLVEQFAELAKDFDSQLAQRIALESLLIRISKVAVEISVDTVLEKIVQLGAGGVGPAPPIAAAAGGQHPPDPPQAARRPQSREPKARREADKGPAKAPDTAQGTPAPPGELVHLTTDNMAREWSRIAQGVTERSLNLGVWLNHAAPAAIERDTLTLRFDPGQAQARKVVERGENRALIEETLRTLTDNIRTVQCELAQDAAGAEPPERARFGPPPGPMDKVSADPHIAQVLNVFKGVVVAVKPKAGAT